MFAVGNSRIRLALRRGTSAEESIEDDRTVSGVIAVDRARDKLRRSSFARAGRFGLKPDRAVIGKHTVFFKLDVAVKHKSFRLVPDGNIRCAKIGISPVLKRQGAFREDDVGCRTLRELLRRKLERARTGLQDRTAVNGAGREDFFDSLINAKPPDQ